MDNLSDMYYLFQLIVRQIFVYLRDIILREFTWFGMENDDPDNFEAKNRFLPSSRHAIADFVALFTICTFLAVFIIISTKSAKDDDEEHFSSSSIAPRNEMIFPEGRFYNDIPCTMTNNTTHGADCSRASGDTGISVNTIWKKRSLRNSSFTRTKRPDSTAESTIRISQSQHSQSTQTTVRALQRAACAQDWLIRKTRSGQVYGRYPM